MIKCKIINRPASLLCNLSTECNRTNELRNKLHKAHKRRHQTPKTFPVEFKGPSHPPVKPDEAKLKCDRDVLKALSAANQIAMKKFDVPVPFTKQMNYHHDHVLSKSGSIIGLQREGYDLAQQFIDAYPESFKIRYPDKLSHTEAQMSDVERYCKNKDYKKAMTCYNEMERGVREVEKSALDSILDLLAYNCYGGREVAVEWEEPGDYYYTEESTGTHHLLPYSKCLYKALNVGYRNVIDIVNKDMKQRPEREAREITKFGKQHRFMEPSEDKHLVVNMMPDLDESFPAFRVLETLKKNNIVSALNYNCLIQAAVKYHNPEVAYNLYQDMLTRSLHPDIKTLAMLVYSITHNTPPLQFVESAAAQRIAPILQEAAGNPDLQLSDEFLVNLFYGVHCSTAEMPAGVREQIARYNHNILGELEQAVEQGAVLIRHSIAYKIIEALNHSTVDGRPGGEFAATLNRTMYKLIMEHPASFQCDLEAVHGDHFLGYLLKLQSVENPPYSVEQFYGVYRPQIKALMHRYMTDTELLVYPLMNLNNLVRHGLTMKWNHPAYGKYSTLEELDVPTTWDYWKDVWRDSSRLYPHRMICDILSAMFQHVEGLDLNKVQPKYLLRKLELFLKYLLEVDGKHLRLHPDTFKPSPFILLILESYVNLIHDYTVLQLDTSPSPLTEKDKLAMCKMVCKAMQYLLEKDGIPSAKMAATFVLVTIVTGHHTEGWGLLNTFHDFRIPLDKKYLTMCVQQTPDFHQKQEEYLSKVYPHMRKEIHATLQQHSRLKSDNVRQGEFKKGRPGKDFTNLTKFLRPRTG